LVTPRYQGHYECSCPPPRNSTFIDAIKTAKFIPIPLLLVPIFLNHNYGLTTVEGFQVFYDEFYNRTSSGLCKDNKFILNFLLVVAGYDAMAKNDWGRISQLAVLMEQVEPDSIIMQQALAQFGGIKHTALFKMQ